jgi:CheY-like chemotaxis protein
VASPSVLIIDNDRDIAEVVRAILTDEGYAVSILTTVTPDSIAAHVGQVEPDCVLLDGSSEFVGYGESWFAAARLTRRERRIPVIMFTANSNDMNEAGERVSARSREADFAAVVPKPFDLDELVAAVRKAADGAVPFDGSPAADAARSAQLVAALERIGARDVRMSTRREWATFRTARERLMQVYWWQAGGSYLVGRYGDDGRRMENVATAYDRASAVEIVASYIREDAAVAA